MLPISELLEKMLLRCRSMKMRCGESVLAYPTVGGIGHPVPRLSLKPDQKHEVECLTVPTARGGRGDRRSDLRQQRHLGPQVRNSLVMMILRLWRN